jgi:hypothetical protein
LASALIAAGLAGTPVFAQKSGGVLKVHHQDSPASMSIFEIDGQIPCGGVEAQRLFYRRRGFAGFGGAKFVTVMPHAAWAAVLLRIRVSFIQ